MTRPTERALLPVGHVPALLLSTRRRLNRAIARRLSRITLTVVSIGFVGLASNCWASQTSAHKGQQKPAKQLHRQVSPGHHIGYASYYARKFFGRKMADGTPMRPESDNAASLTLPLGSQAMVTNLLNGRTALVTIRDRGPFVKGRIIDVSPSTAKLLGILQAGIAQVAVIPLGKLAVTPKLQQIVAAVDAAIEAEIADESQ